MHAGGPDELVEMSLAAGGSCIRAELLVEAEIETFQYPLVSVSEWTVHHPLVARIEHGADAIEVFLHPRNEHQLGAHAELAEGNRDGAADVGKVDGHRCSTFEPNAPWL